MPLSPRSCRRGSTAPPHFNHPYLLDQHYTPSPRARAPSRAPSRTPSHAPSRTPSRTPPRTLTSLSSSPPLSPLWDIESEASSPQSTVDDPLSDLEVDSMTSSHHSIANSDAPNNRLLPDSADEAECLLSIARADLNISRAEKDLADGIHVRNMMRARYSHFQLEKAKRKLTSAELEVGRVRAVARRCGFVCSAASVAPRLPASSRMHPCFFTVRLD
ncbi:hypothetical protein BV22DRAFT_1134498 [Leucogyrophana mollusca]|uniref:Uncharacterized protein n=1 Tax=Leucogyrophana mollusca TaxID=85980 RepID=A0ACB8AYS2_9AGAM|nr:hypothetical protein BV22DRAFT_1134498 [Leucogyrophana mollusca]